MNILGLRNFLYLAVDLSHRQIIRQIIIHWSRAPFSMLRSHEAKYVHVLF